ncbi:DUF3892 domain-containing protein [Enterococcus hirae]
MASEIVAVHYDKIGDSTRITQVKLADGKILYADQVMSHIDLFYTTSSNTKAYVESIKLPSSFEIARSTWTGTATHYFRTQGNETEKDNLSNLPTF